MNHYEVLGIDPAASGAEVHRAYLDAARRHHPDRGGSPADMRRINEAWAVLGDARARRSYDRTVVAAGPGPADALDSTEDSDTDELAADLRDDRPLGRPLRPLITIVPVAMFVASIAIGSMAMVLDEPAVLGFAMLVFGLSLVAVAAVTLLALQRGNR